MRGLLPIAGLILAAVMASADARGDETPALPPGLDELVTRDRSAEGVEERSFTNSAMASASGAYISGDYAMALIHAERAAAGGEARGATLAGHILLHGLSGEPDEAGAVRWLRRAAELNEPDALIVLARLAEAGRAGLSPWQAREYLSRAAEAGDVRAAHEYGLYLMERTDPGAAPAAMDWLRLAAEGGREDAFVDYAYALGEWAHGPQDLTAARLWYERAGEAGVPFGALMAGTMHLHEEGEGADPARGAQLVRMAAESGLAAAMGQYALLLYEGAPGLPADPANAAHFAQQGARRGDPESQFLYAYALATGDGTARDLEEAYVWAVRAGITRSGEMADDPDRQRLEAALSRALDAETLERLRQRAQLPADTRLR
ncbi:sel1 repeat family protein [Alkalicaulis satelles]|uniref:Sel1 repeat family protein n=1 Tax=Alkalicaulis satelles TaxID=2609175 RepID=A0A5M6ZIW2_9PROT|nr:tetratricopeptide repeat protein [Alkalicaulis satelles]KAA5803627.1 sel1 repeat family protein [Alkalicaulis satelles]